MKKLILLLFIPLLSFGQTAIQHSYSGDDKFQNGNYEGAIEDYTKAIEMSPNDADILKLRDLGLYQNWYANIYNSRGYAKGELEDYNGAIEDYKKSLEFDPQNIKTCENILISMISVNNDLLDKMRLLGVTKKDYEEYDKLKIIEKDLETEMEKYIKIILEIDSSNEIANEITKYLISKN